jgi:hypothetical protein
MSASAIIFYNINLWKQQKQQERGFFFFFSKEITRCTNAFKIHNSWFLYVIAIEWKRKIYNPCQRRSVFIHNIILYSIWLFNYLCMKMGAFNNVCMKAWRFIMKKQIYLLEVTGNWKNHQMLCVHSKTDRWKVQISKTVSFESSKSSKTLEIGMNWYIKEDSFSWAAWLWVFKPHVSMACFLIGPLT